MLVMHKVTNLWQALVLRAIRNECRTLVTRDKSKIGYLRQIIWFFTRYLDKTSLKSLVCYLFYENNNPIGYGLATLNDRKNEKGVWISGGLIEEKRGKRNTRDIFRALVKEWGWKQMYVETWATNTDILKLYRELGFKTYAEKEDGKIILLKRPKNRKQLKKIYAHFRYPSSKSTFSHKTVHKFSVV